MISHIQHAFLFLILPFYFSLYKVWHWEMPHMGSTNEVMKKSINLISEFIVRATKFGVNVDIIKFVLLFKFLSQIIHLSMKKDDLVDLIKSQQPNHKTNSDLQNSSLYNLFIKVWTWTPLKSNQNHSLNI